MIFKILYSAYKKTDNIYTSIVGDKITTNIYENKNSEMNKTNWDIIEFIYLISDIFFIKLPIHSPSWVPKIIKKIYFGENSTYLPAETEIQDKTCIIYVNGIMSNRNVVELNRKYLSNLLDNKPVNVMHNVTDSLISDLIECLIGKLTNDLTEAAAVLLHTLCKKMLDPEISKIILIGHSQGTIIISNVLKNLYRLGLDKELYLKKLEIYCFANCATKMNYIINELPYMEHFANNNDYVAALGCNCGNDIKDIISIDGKKFIKKKSGHMLNTHYIDNFKNDFPKSRLNTYINHKLD